MKHLGNPNSNIANALLLCHGHVIGVAAAAGGKRRSLLLHGLRQALGGVLQHARSNDQHNRLATWSLCNLQRLLAAQTRATMCRWQVAGSQQLGSAAHLQADLRRWVGRAHDRLHVGGGVSWELCCHQGCGGEAGNSQLHAARGGVLLTAKQGSL